METRAEILQKLIIVFIAIPFVVYGLLSFVQFLGRVSVDVGTSLQSLVRKDEYLTFKDGLIGGLIYLVFKMFLVIIGLIGNIDHTFFSHFQDVIIFLVCCVMLVALFRVKVKFMIGFIVSGVCLTNILTDNLPSIMLLDLFQGMTLQFMSKFL